MQTQPNSQTPPEFARDHLKRSPELRQRAVAAGIEAIQRGEIPLGLKLLRRAWEAEKGSQLRLPRFSDTDFRAFCAAAGIRGETFNEFVQNACTIRAIDTATNPEYREGILPELVTWVQGELKKYK